jgi:hypothetical protein
MFPIVRIAALAALAIPAMAPSADAGCWCDHHHRYSSHRHVVHGKPRSVFADPVGYAYPEIKYRNVNSGYRPLPNPTPIWALRPAPSPVTPRR